jgi:hypothetical protein
MAGRYGKAGKNWTSANEIPEVMELLEFEKANQADLDRIRPLLEQRDILIQAAEKAVRAREVSCDRFIILSQTETVNWETLFDKIGREQFLDLVGGVIQTVPKYSGDVATYKSAVACGRIPEEVDQKVYKKINRYTIRDR